MEPKIDRDYEKKLAQEKLKPRPGEVTVESSRRHLTEPYETKDKESPVRDTIMTDVVSAKRGVAGDVSVWLNCT